MSSYWKDRFHVGNGETGLIVTFMLLALAISMFISGRVHLKFGMKCCIIIGTTIVSIAYFFLFIANHIYWIYAWGFVVNFGSSFLYGPSLTAGQQAFPTKRGLISGVLNLIFGVSAAIMSPILNIMLEGEGYLFTNIVILSLIVISSVIAALLLRFTEQTQNKHQQGEDLSNDLSVKEALKTKEFWIIWLVWAFMGAAGISMISLAKSYSVAIGETGVIILTAFNLANGICRIFVGWISDFIGTKLTGAIAFLFATVGYIIMPFTKSVPLVSLCVIGVGIGFGTLFTISGPLASLVFGIKNFGMIYGLIFTGYGIVGGMVGPAVSGMLLEKTNNNYTVVFIYLGGMAFIGVLLMLIIKEKKKVRKFDENAKEDKMKHSDLDLALNELESEVKDEKKSESVNVKIEC
eukprot:jgi/Orpsp1_1/1190432/evm.model.d7180000078937.1